MKVCTLFSFWTILNCNLSPVDAHYYRNCHSCHYRHYCGVDRKGNKVVSSSMLTSVILLMCPTVCCTCVDTPVLISIVHLFEKRILLGLERTFDDFHEWLDFWWSGSYLYKPYLWYGTLVRAQVLNLYSYYSIGIYAFMFATTKLSCFLWTCPVKVYCCGMQSIVRGFHVLSDAHRSYNWTGVS